MAKDFLWGEEFKLDVARGKVRGASVVNIFGVNENQTVNYRAVWENSDTLDYVFPPSPLQMDVNSNAADAGVSIKIIGLTTGYVEAEEVVALDATGISTTSTPFFRINTVITIAGNATNNITVGQGSTTYAQIDSGRGRNQAAVYTTPADCAFYLYRIDAFTADGSQQKAGKFRNFVVLPNGVELRVAGVSFFNNMNIKRDFPFKYGEKTDIQLQMATFSGTHPVGVFGEGILVKEIMN